MSEVLSANSPSDVPLVSIVIASVNGQPYITECLNALVSHKGSTPCEILVIDCCDEQTRSVIRQQFPHPEIQLVEIAGRPSIPRLRAIGVQRARGKMIALLEDHCNVGPHWFQAIARACDNGYAVVGGPVENGSRERLIDWAAFFCEYARFMPPSPKGIAAEIAGNNSAYQRELLQSLVGDGDVLEFFLHRTMREMGVNFYCDPDMVVSHRRHFGYFYFLSQRYHYSRAFAGIRTRTAPLWKRLAYAGATPLLPGLLLFRLVRIVLRKKDYAKLLVFTLPVIATFLVSWAWGEAIGALFGPGHSPERVE